MSENEAMEKFQSILQTIELWAEEDVDNDAIMSADVFENAVVENDYNNPIAVIWQYYQYLTGAGDEW